MFNIHIFLQALTNDKFIDMYTVFIEVNVEYFVFYMLLLVYVNLWLNI